MNIKKKYDYLIVGAGLFGSVCAYELKKKGFSVLVLEKRDHIAGNVYTKNEDGVHVHKYGAHIFHTNDKKIWEYINQFAEFNRFTNSPLANYEGKLYNLPFNMNTFYQLWGTARPDEAKLRIEAQRKEVENKLPTNLEEQAISLVGRDVYEIFIKGYTEKQWGRSAKELPADIIKRIPVRFTFDNNYFDDNYQGIPIGGYTQIIEKMLDGIDIILNVDYLSDKEKWSESANRVIYTGAIDEYFGFCLGKLDYRSLKFESERIEIKDYQGNAVVNYTESSVPYTRIIEHKHFDDNKTAFTIITKEYPASADEENEPYYPINDDKNMELFKKYRDLSKKLDSIVFGGRLAEYKYYDMHQVIKSALYTVEQEKNGN